MPAKGARRKRKPPPSTDIAPTTPTGPRSAETVRFHAGLFYASNLAGVSIDEMSKMEQFAGVTKRTLERWSAEDRWLEQRRDFQENVKAALTSEIFSKVMDIRRQQVEVMQQLFDDAVSKLLPDDANAVVPEVKSYEGLLRAVTRSFESLDRMRDRLAETLIPERALTSGSDGDPIINPIKPVLTLEETTAAARVIVEMRRKAQATVIDDDETDDADGDGNGSMVVDAVLDK